MSRTLWGCIKLYFRNKCPNVDFFLNDILSHRKDFSALRCTHEYAKTSTTVESLSKLL